MSQKIVTNIQRGIALIRQVSQTLPHLPGIYKMLDEEQKPLYIGKAKVLAQRVPAYANIESLPNRLKRMVSLVQSIEYITTKTEAEALLLEASLIRSIRPPYNISLKDDKSFPYIIFEDKHDYPRIAKYRGKKKPGVTYFGPFASAKNVNETIVELQKMFLVRPCTDAFFSARQRPCLQYQIKRCSAPCVAKISPHDYGELVKQAKDFLAGKTAIVYERLEKEMASASAQMHYEKAAQIRDRIRMFSQIQARNMFSHNEVEDGDVIALYRDQQGNACLQVFIIRGGKNYGNQPFFYKDIDDQSEQELIGGFIGQFYQKQIPPPRVIVNVELTEHQLIAQALSDLAGYKVKVEQALNGALHDFMEFAVSNAQGALQKHRRENLKHLAALKEIAALFNLKTIPERIEIYDNSHIQGREAVGCMVVAGKDGFRKSEYRILNIKNVDNSDDYAMLREVLTHRFSRLTRDNYPDLILIDGGKGHLSVASHLAGSSGITDIVLVAISKGENRNAGREFFHLVGQKSFQLPKGDAALHYLQVLRDEAHRFAIETHRKRRLKKLSLSSLDDIPHIGKMRKKVLLSHFGSLDLIKEASLRDLIKVPGISKKTAERIFGYLHQ
jgi:excinuclease ABC subunit C